MNNSGNIEPMMYLISFLSKWLLTSKKESKVAGLYYSIIEKKYLLVWINDEGIIQKSPFAETQILKTSNNSNKNSVSSLNIQTCTEVFCNKLFENQQERSNYNKLNFFYLQNAFNNKFDSIYIFPKEKELKANTGQIKLEMPEIDDFTKSIYNLSLQLYEDQAEYFRNFNLLKQHFDHKLHEIEALKKEIEEMKKDSKRFVLDETSRLINTYLKEMKIEKQFSFDDQAVAILMEIDSTENSEFKSAIKDALQLCLMLDGHKESLLIRGNLLNFEKKQGFLKDQQDEEIKLGKVVHYLNELENAANTAQNNGEKITGDAVSRYCMPNPRTAASISDYNNRHNDRIRKLMHDRPNDWPIIRNSFRPIKKLLVKK